MTWNPEVNPWLAADEYDRVAGFYEEFVEIEPEEIRPYWYLGLAYLLAGREEEAQTTWLFVLGQMEVTEIDERTAELVAILDEEAHRQTELQNFDRAWLIRIHTREIAPDYLDNLLQLLLLQAQLEQFHPNQLKEWNIIELVDIQPVNSRLLESVLEMAIGYTHKYSIDLVRSSLHRLPDSSRFIEKLLIQTKQIAYERRLPLYCADLLEVVREYDPDNWPLAVNLFWFYISVPNYSKAYRLAKELKSKSYSTELKLFNTSLLLNGLMRGSNWEEIPSIEREYKQLVQQFLQENPADLHPFVRDSLLSVMNPISYYEDNPLENRPLLSQIGNYFQQKYRQSLGVTALDRPREPSDRPPGTRKIKIGYIAGTFRRHPVGLLSRWVMQYHDREQFDIALYLIEQPVDEITQKWFFNPKDTVRQLSLNSPAIARQIQEDKVDILLDLDSGTTVEIAQVMALKPAPIQVNWLGFDGSGLPAIDYLLADPYVLPENAQEYYSEKIWRLPHSFVAVDGFETAVPTLRREDLGIEDDAVIYLSSQTAFKRNPPIIHLQLQILKAVPHSYFLIQGTADESALRALFLTIAEQEGVDGERIKMIPLYYPTESYRANLAIADVILDTYPFNGGTTTLEALWMGIPVVTRVGQQWSSRNGYTLLTNAGITEGIARNDTEYVEWGIRLGTDAELREEVRWKLRQSRRTSPLWNTRQFTRDLEDAYRQMWEIYREG